MTRSFRKLFLAGSVAAMLFGAPVAALACDGEGPAADTVKAPAGASTVAYTVDGMSCASCSGKVAAAIRKLPGVYTVSVDLESKTAKVAYDAKKVTPEQIKEAISKAGYKPTVVA